MLTIRLRRTGKKKQPSYRIVVAEGRAPIYGHYIEMIGHYNPFTKMVVLDNQKALDWMNKGAKPTNTVAKILQKQNLKHKSILIKKFRAISKKELEAQKAQAEAERAKLQAEKEAAKAAFEERVETEKAAQPSSEEKLQEEAEESIKEIKEEEVEEKASKAPNKASAAENRDSDSDSDRSTGKDKESKDTDQKPA